MLFNCRESEVQKVLDNPISRELYEIGLGQNLLDFSNFESLQF